MQSAQVLITFDAGTGQIQIQSPVSPADCLLLLERAKLMVIQQAFQAKSPIATPGPDLERAILQSANGAARR